MCPVFHLAGPQREQSVPGSATGNKGRRIGAHMDIILHNVFRNVTVWEHEIAGG